MDTQIKIETPSGPIAKSIAARIADEQKRLAPEAYVENILMNDRRRLLVKGTEAEIDECERQLDARRAIQVRILERIDLLAAQLREANYEYLAPDRIAVEAQAHAMREAGERLIRETYAKQAAALATTLRRIAVLDAAITLKNEYLKLGGRPSVPTSNTIRCRPTQRLSYTKTKRVGGAEREHPAFGKIIGRSSDGSVAYLEGGGQCPAYVDVKLDRTELLLGSSPMPLYESITLPNAEAEPLRHESLCNVHQPIPGPIFDLHVQGVSQAEIDALLAEFESASNPSKQKTA